MTSVLKKAMVGQAGEQDTRTPLTLFNELNKEFNFDLDPCTSSGRENNLNVPNYFTKEQDGLKQDWSPFKSIFINPPFRDVKHWVAKIEDELNKDSNKVIVMLVPSKTETQWWHKLLSLEYFKELRFQKGRVKFEGHTGAFIFGISFFVFGKEEIK